MSRVVCFGELLLRLGAPGRELLLQTPQLQVHVGGAEANVAVSLACLGHDVQMVSTVPGNALGRHAVAELRRHGVGVAGVREVDRDRMGLYFLAPGAVHRASEVVYDRAGSAFANSSAEDHAWPALLSGAQLLHVSGISPALGDNVAGSVLGPCVRRARRASRCPSTAITVPHCGDVGAATPGRSCAKSSPRPTLSLPIIGTSNWCWGCTFRRTMPPPEPKPLRPPPLPHSRICSGWRAPSAMW